MMKPLIFADERGSDPCSSAKISGCFMLYSFAPKRASNCPCQPSL